MISAHRHKKTIRFAAILILTMASMTMSAQKKQKTTIFVEHANYSEYNEKKNKDMQRLIGDIVLRHDSTYFYCDSAYLYEKKQDFDGFGNVHINSNDSLHIYGDLIKYTGSTTECVIYGNVRLYDDSTTIVTDEMSYNRTTKIAHYPHSATITHGDNVFCSRKGTYDSENNIVSFYTEVVATTPDCKILTDTMIYYTNAHLLKFFGPTTLTNEDNIIFGKYGSYNSKTKQARAANEAFLENKNQSMAADSIFYSNDTDFAKANGNVVIRDTSNHIIVSCNYGELWKKRGYTFVTDSLMLTHYENSDSLFLSSDSLTLTFDTISEKLSEAKAFDNVRFYRKDIQGKCGLLDYHKSDSTIKLRMAPIVWSDSSQMTATSIRLTTANKKIDSIFLNGRGFIAMHDSLGGFNQIKGDTIVSVLKDNKPSKITSTRNAEMVFHAREDDGTLTGMNNAKATSIVFLTNDNKIKNVIYKGKSSEVMYPEKEINEKNSILEGFAWHNNIRPRSKDDVMTEKSVKPSEATPQRDEASTEPDKKQKRRRR